VRATMRMWSNKATALEAAMMPPFHIVAHRRARVSFFVSCDMKLHSVLLGWTGFLTKPCVSPQVFHGSMRLTGCGFAATTVRGVKPSR
jgi:hypothetical protein